MAVLKRGRRQIIIKGRAFVWWVRDSFDQHLPTLHIVSEDKRLVAHYLLNQPVEAQFITIVEEKAEGKTYLCPPWHTEGPVTPAMIIAIVFWCGGSDKQPVKVEKRGGMPRIVQAGPASTR